MNNKTLFSIIFIFLVFAGGCFQQPNNEEQSQYSSEAPSGLYSASVSPDDRRIVFSFDKNGFGSIYIADVDGANVKKLVSSKDYDYYDPKFSPDDSKIIFLADPKNATEQYNQLYIMDSNAKNIKPVTSGYITEAVFAPDGKTIYFLNSGYFGHYSPIARSHPHEYDIYSVTIDGSDIKRITNLTAYQMDSLSVSSDGNSLLLKITGSSFRQYLLNISDDKLLFNDEAYSKVHNPLGSIIIVSINASNKLTELKMDYDKLKQLANETQVEVYGPTKSQNGEFLAFTLPYYYDLFIMNFTNKEVKQLTDFKKFVYNINFFNTKNKLLFFVDLNWPQRGQNRLMQINADGSNLTEINLQVPDK